MRARPLDLLGRQRAHHLGRRAEDQRAVGELLAFGDQRAGADQAVRPIRAPLSTTAWMPISEPSPTRAAVQHHLVADRHVVAQRQREAGVGVQHAAVLHVAARADRDPVVVAAQHRAVPDAGVFAERHAADHRRAVGDPGAGGDCGTSSSSW